MTIDVDTIQGQLRWAAAHVGQEIPVTGAPVITDGDASPAVMSKVFVSGVQASIFHICPNSVFTGALVSLTMIFANITPTTFGITGSQIGFLDQHCAPAVAVAPVLLPNRNADFVFASTALARFGGALRDDCEARETLIEDVAVLRHEPVYGTHKAGE